MDKARALWVSVALWLPPSFNSFNSLHNVILLLSVMDVLFNDPYGLKIEDGKYTSLFNLKTTDKGFTGVV